MKAAGYRFRCCVHTLRFQFEGQLGKRAAAPLEVVTHHFRQDVTGVQLPVDPSALLAVWIHWDLKGGEWRLLESLDLVHGEVVMRVLFVMRVWCS